MAPLTLEKYYDYHSANLRATGHALDQIERMGKEAIRRADDAATLTATRLYTLLLAAGIEVRLLKIVHEARVDNTDRDMILKAGSQRDKWVEAIDTGFRRTFGIAPTQEVGAALDITPALDVK